MFRLGTPSNLVQIRCLICSLANGASVVANLCPQCYATGTASASHKHHVSFYACDSDPIVQNSRLPQQVWITRMNAAGREWYEHCKTKYQTYIRPMTAVCGLPAGWRQLSDPEGQLYYENTETHERSRQRPGGLPQGWREAKDPDGKVFYVHDALQLASWYRPGEQPVVRPRPRPVTFTSQSTLPITAPSSSNIVVQYSNPGITVEMPIATVGEPTAAVIAPSTSAHVTLGGAAVATINLLDPTEGGIVRSTKKVAYIAAHGVNSAAKKVKNNKRLKSFAKGTGMTEAAHSLERVWRDAGQAVDSLDRRVVSVNEAGVFTENRVLEEYEQGLQHLYLQQQFAVQHEPCVEQSFIVGPETYLDQGIVAEQDVYVQQNISVVDNEIGVQNVWQELAIEEEDDTEEDDTEQYSGEMCPT